LARTITYKLPSGKTVDFEVSDAGGGTRDFAGGAGKREGGALDAAMEKLGETLAVIAGKLDAVRAMGPEKIEVELSAEISSGGAVKVLLGEGKGGLKIKLVWDNAKK